MPVPCFLSILGSSQGLITKGANSIESVGDSYVEGHEDQILVQSVGMACELPFNRQSGQPAGQRMHSPLRVTFEVNKALPLLYNALCSGEGLENVTLDWYRISIEGWQERFFETQLFGARIIDIQVLLPDSRDSYAAPFNNFVHVWFSYRGISNIHLKSGTVHVDDWRNPREVV